MANSSTAWCWYWPKKLWETRMWLTATTTSLFPYRIVTKTRWYSIPWWRHQMEIFSVLLAICAGKSPVTGEFPSQRPVTRSFDVFFDLRLNKRLSKQSRGWWFETPSRPLWRHCNDIVYNEQSVTRGHIHHHSNPPPWNMSRVRCMSSYDHTWLESRFTKWHTLFGICEWCFLLDTCIHWLRSINTHIFYDT